MAAQPLARTNLWVAGQGNINTSKNAISRSGQSNPASPKVKDNCTTRDRTQWLILHSNAKIFRTGKSVAMSLARTGLGESIANLDALNQRDRKSTRLNSS